MRYILELLKNIIGRVTSPAFGVGETHLFSNFRANLLIILCILNFIFLCKTADNRRFHNDPTKRFLIPVFQFSGYGRDKNLELTKAFAKEWKDASGLEYFIKDKKITEDILRSGSLVPSTNYSINCEFHELGTKITMVCTLTDLENGELIASDSIQTKDISEIEKEMRPLAKKIFSVL